MKFKPIQAKDTERKFRKKYQQSEVKEIKPKLPRTSFNLSIFLADIWLLRYKLKEPIKKFGYMALETLFKRFEWVIITILGLIGIAGIVAILWSLA